MEKEYRLQVANYYEWKNFREKGITITVTCGNKKGFVHGTGHTPIREIVRKVTEMVYHEH
jgi:hypothetical protein